MSHTNTRIEGLIDLNGASVNPFDDAAATAIVFIFVRTDCPIANRYAPEIARLYRKYSDRIAFWLVYPDAETSPEEIATHMKEYSLALRAIQDPKHTLVKRAQVRVTPESAVFLSNGRQVYHGRIDNWFVDFGKQRPAPTQHELEDCLGAIVHGKPVAMASTLAVGCYIEKR